MKINFVNRYRYHFNKANVIQDGEVIATQMLIKYRSPNLLFGLSNGFFRMSDGRVGVGAYGDVSNFVEYRREDDGWRITQDTAHDSYKQVYKPDEVECIVLDKLARTSFLRRLGERFFK